MAFRPAGRVTVAKSDDVAPRALLFPSRKVARTLSHEREATTFNAGSTGHVIVWPSRVVTSAASENDPVWSRGMRSVMMPVILPCVGRSSNWYVDAAAFDESTVS